MNANGRDAIIDMPRDATAVSDFAMHSFTNPIIDLEGDISHGHWLLWVAIKTADKADQVFQSEVLTYLRMPDGWRIQTLDLHFGTLLK